MPSHLRAGPIFWCRYDLLADPQKREAYDARLEREDAVARQVRARQRAVAAREARRLARDFAELAWEHKRVTAAVLLLLALRLG